MIHMSTPESIVINSAIINVCDKPGDWEWTYHIAHPNGWMFGIPVSNRSSWGYLYNNKVTTKEEPLRTHIDSLENIGFPDNILITINLEIT